MTKYLFTKKQFDEIKLLLKRRLTETRDEQKKSRAKIRNLGFKISDYFTSFTDQDFQELLNCGVIKLVDHDATLISEKKKDRINNPILKKNDKEKKSLPPIVNNSTRILILGTMPSEDSLSYQQYYNNPNNQFWKIIFSILNKGVSINKYNKKMELLEKHKIGLWDVIDSCEREGSADRKISNQIINDFDSFFSRFPNIKIVLFNGQDSFKFYKSVYSISTNKKFLILSSTSSLNTHKTIDEKIKEWEKGFKINYL